MRRLIKKVAEKEIMNYEEIANKVFSMFDLNELKKDMLGVHSEVKNENDLTNNNNDYTVCLFPIFPNATDKFEIAHHFADYVFPGQFKTEPLTSSTFDEIWDVADQVFSLVANKITNFCNLDGYFYFGTFSDGTYSLFYRKPNFIRDEEIVDTLEESIESYEEKRRRMEELPEIIDQALANRDKEVFMKATEELKELKEFFKESKKRYRLRRLANKR